MSEHDNSAPGNGLQAGWAGRLGNDFRLRLAAGLGMGAVALAFTLAGVMPFAVLVVLVALVVAWEWGRLVHGAEAGAVVAVLIGSGGAGRDTGCGRLGWPGFAGAADRRHSGGAAEPWTQQHILRAGGVLRRLADSGPDLAEIGRVVLGCWR